MRKLLTSSVPVVLATQIDIGPDQRLLALSLLASYRERERERERGRERQTGKEQRITSLQKQHN